MAHQRTQLVMFKCKAMQIFYLKKVQKDFFVGKLEERAIETEK